METIIGIILLVAAVFLIASVLLQSSKSHKLPGAIAGGAETFFGKTKGSKIDHILEIATAVVAVVFCVLVIVLYIAQDTTDYEALLDSIDTSAVETQDISAMTPDADTTEETAGETEADAVEETEADTAETEADAVEETEADAAETEAEAEAPETAAETEADTAA